MGREYLKGGKWLVLYLIVFEPSTIRRWECCYTDTIMFSPRTMKGGTMSFQWQMTDESVCWRRKKVYVVACIVHNLLPYRRPSRERGAVYPGKNGQEYKLIDVHIVHGIIILKYLFCLRRCIGYYRRDLFLDYCCFMCPRIKGSASFHGKVRTNISHSRFFIVRIRPFNIGRSTATLYCVTATSTRMNPCRKYDGSKQVSKLARCRILSPGDCWILSAFVHI